MKGRSNEAGLTLVELMMVVAIIAVLAVIAIPAFTGENAEEEFNRVVGTLQQDLLRARFGALSTKEDQAVRLVTSGGARYQLVSITNTTAAVTTLIRQQNVRSDRVKVLGLTTCASIPGSTGCNSGSAAAAGTIRFSSIADTSACQGAGCASVPSSATVFIESADGRYRARVVVSQSTGYIRRYEGF